MEEHSYFRRMRVIPEKLPPYGFVAAADGWQYTATLLDGQFQLLVSIAGNGRVDTTLLDAASGEEYVLHRVPGAVGAFAGSVRQEYEAVMLDLAANCFETEVFKSVQAKALIAHVRGAYGDEPEYLWEKFPDNAVWRRKDNEKWYGALLTVSKRKLGMKSDEMVEIIDLRAEPERLERLVDGKRFFPGWHMNKKNWFTVLLDGSAPTEEIVARLEESRQIAAKK